MFIVTKYPGVNEVRQTPGQAEAPMFLLRRLRYLFERLRFTAIYKQKSYKQTTETRWTTYATAENCIIACYAYAVVALVN